MNARFKRMITTSTEEIKRKTVRKKVYDSVTGMKFGVDRIESWKNFIELIVYVSHMAL